MEQGCVEMPAVEEALATHLSPSSVPSWKLRPSPAGLHQPLIGNSYITASQAGEALDTMVAFQAYQADVYKDMDEVADSTPETVKELTRTTDLVLQVYASCDKGILWLGWRRPRDIRGSTSWIYMREKSAGIHNP